jgi:ComF family protein
VAEILKLIDPVVRFALPPRCAGCGTVTAEDHRLCLDCWAKLDFLSGAGCPRCGVPVVPEGLICARCLATPPHHDGARAAVAYDDLSRSLALRLKHGRRIGLAKMMAGVMARWVEEPDALLVPVPLHRWRIWRRGFNQSLLIANAISKKTGNLVLLDSLVRKRATPMLGGLGAKERAAAVRGAFVVPETARTAIRGKSLILVDDVYTSGATADACARTLRRAGAARVTVLAWARVLRGDDAHD